jgi:hypothetical protein
VKKSASQENQFPSPVMTTRNKSTAKTRGLNPMTKVAIAVLGMFLLAGCTSGMRTGQVRTSGQ